MPFILRISCPTIERVVERHSRLKLFEIIAVHARETQREGEQSGGLRGEIMAVCVRAPHNCRHGIKGGYREFKFAQERIETARLAAMAEGYVFHIKRSCGKLLRDERNILRGDEEELSMRIDETPNQPRTGDAVNLGSMARDPNRAALRIGGW